MASGVTVVVLGLEDLRRSMQGLTSKLTDKPMRRAVALAAGEIRDAARAESRKTYRTGEMLRAISTRRDTKDSIGGRREIRGIGVFSTKKAVYVNNARNRQKGRVGKKYTLPPPAYYWRFIEFGTVKMPAQPFLRPAFEATKFKAVNRLRDELLKEINRAIRNSRR